MNDGVALTSISHPKGEPLKRGRPTNERVRQRGAAVETIEIEWPPAPPKEPLRIPAKYDI